MKTRRNRLTASAAAYAQQRGTVFDHLSAWNAGRRIVNPAGEASANLVALASSFAKQVSSADVLRLDREMDALEDSAAIDLALRELLGLARALADAGRDDDAQLLRQLATRRAFSLEAVIVRPATPARPARVSRLAQPRVRRPRPETALPPPAATVAAHRFRRIAV